MHEACVLTHHDSKKYLNVYNKQQSDEKRVRDKKIYKKKRKNLIRSG